MDTYSAEPAYHALLIGIDQYPHDPLESCVLDVRSIRRRLSKSNFSVKVLAAESTPIEPPGVDEMAPTFDNIIESMRHLTATATPGDYIYIHFSGHGTRDPNHNAIANHQPGDLALVVHQGHGDSGTIPRIRYLWGWDLANEVRVMVEKGLHVTLVLDCCFSGSIMRKGSGHEEADSGWYFDDGTETQFIDSEPRCLDYDPEVDAAFPLIHTTDSLDSVTSSDVRDAAILPTWMGKPQGYAVITACGPTEIAEHIKINGKKYGALSYFLIRALMRSGLNELRGPFGNVYEELRTRFLNKKQKPIQNPMWYGDRSRGIFGTANVPGIRSLLFPVVLRDDGEFWIECGNAHGISARDQFDVFTPSCPDVALRGTVKSIGELSSRLNITNSSSVRNGNGLLARALTSFSLLRYPVHLDADLGLDPYAGEWQRQQEARPWLCFNDRENPFSFKVTRSCSGAGYQIRNSSDHEINHLPLELPTASQTLDAIEHLAKFNLTKDLSKEGVGTISADEFYVQLVNPNNISHNIEPGHMTTVEEFTALQLVMENKSSDILYFYMVDLCPRWNVTNSLDASYVAVEPERIGNSREGFRAAKNPNRRPAVRKGPELDMMLPEELVDKGYTECVDVFKVFVTRRPVTFDTLRMPKIGEALGLQDPIMRGETDEDDTDDDRRSNDWAVVDFPITIMKQAD
ncbi:caspase domain-containing protein [Hypoxylon sp. FL1857]|nr:caspase domain-containing protein [Hypoxylon sp. FL1857]